MSLELKNKLKIKNILSDWRPTASLHNLKIRAEVLELIRTFFKNRDVLEVETPLLCRTANTDPYLQPIPVITSVDETPFYLQTSPEFAMKRLLASGCGCIYQITKAFRNGEIGRHHNLEFTMLEWYRIDFDHHDLMNEMSELLSLILNTPAAKKITYSDLFKEKINIDPLNATLETLKATAIELGIEIDKGTENTLNQDDWLDLLMTHCIEPSLGFDRPVMVYDFPASKAALAKVREDSPPVAERFEVYVRGLELANGFHELQESIVQLKRFEDDCIMREKLKYPAVPIDEKLIAALESGFPACAGVALGIDRLLMLKLEAKNIQEVVTFTIDKA